ncbi:MAG: lysophospholipid acyltransferase family protein [Bdellovibrionales bacterium]
MKSLIFLRSLGLTIWFFFHTLICAITLVVGAQFLPSPWFPDLVIGTLWARPVLWLGKISVEVRGAEYWPAGEGCLVLFNHTSWVDIIVMAACLPRIPRFGAKIELFRIPFFGRAMRKAGMLPIERNSRTKVLQVYKAAEDRAAKGECFALSPEGTRQADLILGRFKQGPFLFAVGAQTQIVPLVIAGAREVMPRSSWLLCSSAWQNKVITQILPPISCRGLNDGDLAAIQARVRAEMEPAYARLNHELGLEDRSPVRATLSPV